MLQSSSSSSLVLLLSLQLLPFLVLCSSFGSREEVRSLAQSPSCNKTFQCGNSTVEARDPFTTLDANGSCRSLITCNNDDGTGSLRMVINSLEYSVASVDYAVRKLVIAAVGRLVQNFCSSPPNASMDVSPFVYTERDVLATQLRLRNCSRDASGALPGVASCGLACCYTTGDPEVVQSRCGEVQFMPALIRSPAGNGSPLGENLVSVWSALKSGFEVTWTPRDGTSGCEACVQSGGVCRNLSAPHSVPYCFCPQDGVAYMYKCPPQDGVDEGKRHQSHVRSIIGVVASGTFLLVCLLVYLVCRRKLGIPELRKLSIAELPNFSFPELRKKRSKPREDGDVGSFLERFGSLPPKRYSFSDVQKMTFDFSNNLGQGGYGCVYKGMLEDGCLVAVKVLNSSEGSGNKDFFNEVISIGCTYHVNIVTLLGFCLEDSKRILIYEFMPNGSLEKFIYAIDDERSVLDREMLLRIATGIARGLQYLHHGCNTGILHFDIKPSNILLDETFCPKIADFGLAKICRSAERKMKMLVAGGTVGYIAPEVFLRKFGGVSSKSDVYSFGMMLLEMVGGRKKIYMGMNNTTETFLPHWIYKHIDLGGGLISSSIMTEAEGELARRMVVIGLWCIQTNPSDRPSMSNVLDMLEGRIEELTMPPMPFLCSPLVSTNNFAAVDQSQGQASVDASSSIQSCQDTPEPQS